MVHDRDARPFRICHETMFVTKKSTGLVSLVRKRMINRTSLPIFFPSSATSTLSTTSSCFLHLRGLWCLPEAARRCCPGHAGQDCGNSHGGFRLHFPYISHHLQYLRVFAMPLVVVTSFVLSWRWRDVPTPSCTISVEVVDINKDMKADLVHHFLRFCQFCHILSFKLSFKRLHETYMKPQKRTALSHHLISRIVIQKRHWRSRRRMPSWHMRRAPRHV